MFGCGTRLDDFLLYCRNICFAGMSRDGISSSVASSFALHVSELGHSVCYTECDVPVNRENLLYDSVAMDQRFERKGFVDFYAYASDEVRLHTFSNMERGVNWRLITPENVKENLILTPLQMSRLVFSARADVCIFDFGECSMYNMLLDDMDAVVFFVDPLPSRIVRNIEKIKSMQKKFLNYPKHLWVIYNMNGGISKRQIKGLLRDSEVYWLGELDRKELYSCEYRCRFPWESAVLRNEFEELFISN